MTRFDAQQVRSLLTARKAELQARLERIRANLVRGLDPDSKERAKELEDSDVVDALGNEATGELLLIGATLARLDKGSYGTCAECGAEIGSARLQAYPYASKCIHCAEDDERLQRFA